MSSIGGIAKASIMNRRKNVKKGLSFTVMIVGSAGLGKSTFVNTLCESNVIPKRDYGNSSEAALEKTVAINPHTIDMEEDGVKMSLTVIDTPGFGDNINNEKSFKDILEYIEKQYDDILSEENRIKRHAKFQDNRVHALLYFIPPTGHSLKEIDIEFMKELGSRVNVIPVIAKSDGVSPTKLASFKKRIMEDIAHYKIPIYNFPYDEEEDDDETVDENNELRSLLPFAVVGSAEEITMNGRRVRCRQYPWGVVEVDNNRHCDFSKLRYMLLSSHLQDLKEITHDFLYEQYRTEKLSREGDVDPDEDAENYEVRAVVVPINSQPSTPPKN
jgi:cell division control protein 11